MYNRFVLWENNACFVDDPKFTDINELTNPASWSIRSERAYSQITEPVFFTEDTAERLKTFMNSETFWSSCLSFYRRDFLITNQILFSSMTRSEDAPFVFECLLSTKKYLLVPNTAYIVRPRLDSASRYNNQNINAEDYLHKEVKSLRDAFNEFEKIMNKFSFFREHINYRYAVLDFFFQKTYSFRWQFQSIYAQIPPFALNELVKREFHPDDAAFAAYLFNTVNIQRLQIMQLQHELAKFHKQ